MAQTSELRGGPAGVRLWIPSSLPRLQLPLYPGFVPPLLVSGSYLTSLPFKPVQFLTFSSVRAGFGGELDLVLP